MHPMALAVLRADFGSGKRFCDAFECVLSSISVRVRPLVCPFIRQNARNFVAVFLSSEETYKHPEMTSQSIGGSVFLSIYLFDCLPLSGLSGFI